MTSPRRRANDRSLLSTQVTHVITGLTTGGAERVLLKLLEASDRSRYTPAVVSLMDEGAIGKRIRALDVPVHCLGMKRSVPSLAHFRRLRSMVADTGPDIVQGWMYHGNIAAQFTRPRNSRLIWGIHQSITDLGNEKPLTRLLVRLGRWTQSGVDAIVFCSARSAQQHAALGYSVARSRIIANGVDTLHYNPSCTPGSDLRRELGLEAGSLLVGHAARYHPMKNHRGLLEAFAMTESNARLLLMGPEVDESNRDLMQQILRLGLNDRVLLLGERTDLWRLMPLFDLYVSASSWGEAMPMVLLEAMSCGVPCVTTDVGDSAHLVGDTGRVVAPDAGDALAGALRELLGSDTGRRAELGQRARQRVVEHFSLQQMTQRYCGLYDELHSI